MAESWRRRSCRSSSISGRLLRWTSVLIATSLGITLSVAFPSGVISASSSPSASPTCSEGAGLGGATTVDGSQGGHGCVVIAYGSVFETFNYTGTPQTWTVPSGVESVEFHLLGAGGGGGRNTTTATGGGGGYAAGRYSVTQGAEFTVIVGQGGRRQTLAEVRLLTDETMRRNVSFGGGGTGRTANTAFNLMFASGGGRSAIRSADGTEIVTAGGGGGGGYGGAGGGFGGPGGGLIGGSAAGAGGGTQTAGGARDTSFAGSVAGIQFAGGFADPTYQSGGGGGGWYGGGGGAGNRGGGGGSSYVALLTGGITVAGSGREPGLRAPVNTTAPQVVGPIGKAVGTTVTANGGAWSTPGVQSWTWQYSADGTDFSDISGATSATYVTTQAGYYRAVETHSNLLFSTSVTSSNVIQHLELSPTSTPSCTTGAGAGGLPFGNSLTEIPKSIGGHGCVVIEYRNGGARLYETFNYAGADQGWIVPNGVNEVNFHLIGAGGGGATKVGFGTGGAGGYATGSYPVSPGDSFEIIVGQAGGGVRGISGTAPNCLHTPRTYGGGGEGGSCQVGGYPAMNWSYSSGGGRSAVRVTGENSDLATAGGGGGGGYGLAHGGAAGGLVGSQGMLNGRVNRNGGGGGTQTAGGVRGYSQRSNGTAGLLYQGGRSDDEGGGGGGGYFGGGAGGDNAGGGGGSGFVGRLTNGYTIAGSGTSPGSSAPVNTSPPVITGYGAIGSTLGAQAGTWATEGFSTWQWQYSTDGINFVDVDLATFQQLSVLSPGWYRVQETRSTISGEMSVFSDPIEVRAPVIAPCTPTAGLFTNCQRFNFYGAGQTFTVPGDMPVGSVFTVELWGAGGGGIDGLQYRDQGGGAGGYQKIQVPVTQIGQSFTIVVGEGGMYRDITPQYAGGGAGGPGTAGGSSGGGYSGIFLGTDLSTPLAVVGGGGGASPIACCGAAIVAGGGGGIGAGGQGTDAATAGRAGTTTSGGPAATRTDADCIPTAGSYLRGGNGCGTPGSRDGGGGGGGGYFGGGGGIYGGPTAVLVNGSGGGGSGYIDTAAVTSVAHQQGPNGVQENFSYPLRSSDQWVSPAGVGGKAYTASAAQAAGGHGLVVVQWALPPQARPSTFIGGSSVTISATPTANDSAGGGGTIDVSTLRLCGVNPQETPPACTQTTVTTAAGTYTVNTSTGVVTFDGTGGGQQPFVGTDTVTYSVADGSGSRASSTLSITAVAPPSAGADVSAAQMGDPQTLALVTNDIAGAGATMDSSSVRLCGVSPSEVAPGCTQTAITIDGEGTYSVDQFGTVSFTGTASAFTRVIEYIVRDSVGQMAASTATFISLPPPAVSALPDVTTSAYNSAVIFAPLVNDSAGTVPSEYTTPGQVEFLGTSFRLCASGQVVSATASACNATTLVVTGEGTWTLDPNSLDVTFVPLPSFAGDTTPVTYAVCNQISGTWVPSVPPETCGSAPLRVTVDPPATPSESEPATETGQMGDPVSLNLGSHVTGVGLTAIRLCEAHRTPPDCFSTTITIPGEGTWTLDPSTGTVTFVPLFNFAGAATPLRYTLSDVVGQNFDSTISATIVIPDPPVAVADAVHGAAGTSIGTLPLANDVGASLSRESLRLCVPASPTPDCTHTSVVVAGEGTWTVIQGTGAIEFAPEPGFIGTVAMSYQVSDILSRPTSALLTVTVSPIAAPQTPDLGSDSGSDANDGITNVTTPLVGSSGAAHGDTVTVSAVQGNVTISCTYVASSLVDSCELPELADGEWALTSIRTDPVGNTSLPSSPTTIVIVTATPATPEAPVIQATGITGSPSTGYETPDPNLFIDLGEVATNSAVVVTAVKDGETVSCTYVKSAVTTGCELTGLTDGLWTITAIVTDVAGNDSASSPPQYVKVGRPSPAPVSSDPSQFPVPSAPVGPDDSVPVAGPVAGPRPVPTVNGSLPQLPPGESQAFENGIPVNVSLEVLDGSRLALRGPDFELLLSGDCGDGDCSIVTDASGRETLVLERDGSARVSGFGFLPGSLVHVWIFSDPVYLGALTVAEDGTFAGPMSLLGIPVGEHTLQVNGISFDGAERTADLGVLVAGSHAQLPMTGGGHGLLLAGVLCLLLGIWLQIMRTRCIAGARTKSRSGRLRRWPDALPPRPPVSYTLGTYAPQRWPGVRHGLVASSFLSGWRTCCGSRSPMRLSRRRSPISPHSGSSRTVRWFAKANAAICTKQRSQRWRNGDVPTSAIARAVRSQRRSLHRYRLRTVAAWAAPAITIQAPARA